MPKGELSLSLFARGYNTDEYSKFFHLAGLSGAMLSLEGGGGIFMVRPFEFFVLFCIPFLSIILGGHATQNTALSSWK